MPINIRSNLSILFILACFLCTHPNTARADQRAFFSKIFQELTSLGLPVDYLTQAAKKLKHIKFTDLKGKYSAKYIPFTNTLVLPHFVQMSNGALKPLNEWGSDDVGLLYHELWHVYFHKIAKRKRFFSKWFKDRARTLYRTLPILERKDCLEETLGVFIQNVIRHYTDLQRHWPAKSSKERRQRLQGTSMLSMQQIINAPYYGYYTKSKWQLKTPVIKEEIIYVNVSIANIEKVWILGHLLQNKLRY